MEAQVKAAAEEAQEAEGKAAAAVKRAEQAEEALKRAEDALDQSLGEKNDKKLPNFDRGFSESERQTWHQFWQITLN